MAKILGSLFIDGEGAIEDETRRHSITVVGNSVVSTSAKMFGDSSIRTIAPTDYLTIPNHADFDFGSGNFTIDFWHKFVDVPGSIPFFSKWGATDTTQSFQFTYQYVAGGISFYVNPADNYQNTHAIFSSFTPSIGPWYHLAITKQDSTVRIFINGVKIGADRTFEHAVYNTTAPFQIMAKTSVGYGNGYTDNFRVVKGSCLWTSNFNLTEDALFYTGVVTPNVYVRPNTLSGLYDVSLKRGIRNATKNGFIRPTIGECFVTDEDYTAIPGPTSNRGIFGGGTPSIKVIDFITINTLSNAVNFGELIVGSYYLASCSNSINNRGIFAGGYSSPTKKDRIEYVTINSYSNALNFGNLSSSKYCMGCTSNDIQNRGVFAGAGDGEATINVIEYIAINSAGNTTDFGDLTVSMGYLGGTSNGTNNRGVFGGGYPGNVTTISYITINTLGNATFFGDLTLGRYTTAGTSNGTSNRGVFGGGYRGPSLNVIDYITINTTGNATDFGDLLSNQGTAGACSNKTNNRGVFAGGNNNVVEYITINTLGNATDFGDLTVGRASLASCSNS